MAEPAADMLLVYFMTPGENVKRAMEGMGIRPEQIGKLTDKLFDDQAKAMAALCRDFQKPIIGFSFHPRENPILQKLRDYGIPVLASPQRAARAMAAMVRYGRLRSGWSESK
jgi:acetyl-CoA synthetase (ADP-forming)